MMAGGELRRITQPQSAQDRRGKAENIYHGGAETRRKPQLAAD
jgi:hypothetical protein